MGPCMLSRSWQSGRPASSITPTFDDKHPGVSCRNTRWVMVQHRPRKLQSLRLFSFPLCLWPILELIPLVPCRIFSCHLIVLAAGVSITIVHYIKHSETIKLPVTQACVPRYIPKSISSYISSAITVFSWHCFSAVWIGFFSPLHTNSVYM